MQVRLKVLRGKSKGKEVRVPGPKFLIGRAEDANLRPRSDVVSRRHCEISIDGDEITVRDLGSRNGTFLNGVELEEPKQAVEGDHLKVGKLEFEILIKHELAEVGEEVGQPADSGEFDDSDISDWLDEAQQVERVRRLTDPETRQFKLDETDRLKLEQAGQETERITDHDTSDDKKKAKPEKKAPGKLPKPTGPSSKDSREAASDMLKKFFNAR
jgi:pSer/pThr/pTyr-binding forkhead associated (FHA) protein